MSDEDDTDLWAAALLEGGLLGNSGSRASFQQLRNAMSRSRQLSSATVEGEVTQAQLDALDLRHKMP